MAPGANSAGEIPETAGRDASLASIVCTQRGPRETAVSGELRSRRRPRCVMMHSEILRKRNAGPGEERRVAAAKNAVTLLEGGVSQQENDDVVVCQPSVAHRRRAISDAGIVPAAPRRAPGVVQLGEPTTGPSQRGCRHRTWSRIVPPTSQHRDRKDQRNSGSTRSRLRLRLIAAAPTPSPSPSERRRIACCSPTASAEPRTSSSNLCAARCR